MRLIVQMIDMPSQEDLCACQDHLCASPKSTHASPQGNYSVHKALTHKEVMRHDPCPHITLATTRKPKSRSS